MLCMLVPASAVRPRSPNFLLSVRMASPYTCWLSYLNSLYLPRGSASTVCVPEDSLLCNVRYSLSILPRTCRFSQSVKVYFSASDPYTLSVFWVNTSRFRIQNGFCWLSSPPPPDGLAIQSMFHQFCKL